MAPAPSSRLPLEKVPDPQCGHTTSRPPATNAPGRVASSAQRLSFAQIPLGSSWILRDPARPAWPVQAYVS